MGILVAIVTGGIIGWLASLITKTDNQMGLFLNVVVGIIGAILASWFFGDVLGFGGALLAGSFSLLGIFWGVIGATIILGILKLLNR